jgi:hypothetical protein
VATAKRKFYYYRTGPDEVSFLDRVRSAEGLELQLRASVTHGGRQVMFVTHNRENFLCGYITLLRDDQVPSLGERNSPIGTPMQLAANQGVLEQSHFVFMPSSRVLVFEYNHFGPRVNLLIDTLNQLYQDNINDSDEEITYSYVPRGDALDRLRRGRGVIGFDMSFVPMAETTSDSSTSLHGLFRHAAEIGEPQNIEIVLKGTKSNKLMSVTSFMDDLTHSGRDVTDYKKLKVKIENSTGAVEVIDLLQDRVVSELSVIRLDQHRQLDADDAYQKVITDLSRRFGDNAGQV